jgi:hypothetical protein
MNVRASSLAAAILLVTACGESTSPEDAGDVAVAAMRGRLAFTANCASCHTSDDGLDLAFFGFADSTIMRRALKHVDRETANDIIAHITTLRSNPHPRDERLFQPGGVVLANDATFGQTLFPGDVLPANLTTAQLRALDRMNVRVAVALPRWSVENANTDWMPDEPMSAVIMADQNSLPTRTLDTYRATPTDANLLSVMLALFSALERNNSPGPCHFESTGPKDPIQCFQATRWASTIVAQHMMRNGLTRPFADTSYHTLWWEVGESMRRAQGMGLTPDNMMQNRASWMYLAWMFGAGMRPTQYMLPAFESLGLYRHSTWIALSSMVRRPLNSGLPYDDVQNIPRYGYGPWHYAALRVAYTHLLERLQSGDLPPVAQRAAARTKVTTSFNEGSAYAGITAAQRDELRSLSTSVVNAIPLN